MDSTDLARQLLLAVPANRRVGLEVLQAADGIGRVSVTTSDDLSGVIGSLHAGGLTALVDASGLAAILSVCATEEQARSLVPVGRSAALNFRAAGRGRLIGECVLDRDAVHALRHLLGDVGRRVALHTTSMISDESGNIVCAGTFHWSVRRGVDQGSAVSKHERVPQAEGVVPGAGTAPE
jgi:acyl-coenzyme A thioesterase PaaI-like protein